MGFCTKCGRQLNDGEVCNCQSQTTTPVQPVQPQAAQPQAASINTAQAGAFFGKVWSVIKGVITKPVETISSYVNSANVAIACVLIGCNALAAFLVRWFRLLKVNSAKSSSDVLNNMSLDDILSYASGSSRSSKLSAGYMFKHMFFDALEVCLIAAVVAVVIMLFANVLAKVKMSYVKALCITSLSAIIATPATIIAWLFGLFGVEFFTQLASWISTFSVLCTAAFMYIGIKAVVKNENKIPFIMGLTAFGSGLMSYLVYLISK